MARHWDTLGVAQTLADHAIDVFDFDGPSHHRVHHGSNPEYVDRNFGGVLIVFDRLFGTFAVERPGIVIRRFWI